MLCSSAFFSFEFGVLSLELVGFADFELTNLEFKI